MKTITLSALSLFNLSLVACASGQAQAPKGALMKTSQTPSIHVFESDANGFNTNTVFYDNGEEVVAFDAQFTEALAKQSIEFLRSKTQNPITYLVITHPNPDKFNGASVFKEEGATIVASSLTAQSIEGVHAYKKYFFVNMAKMFTEDSYPKPVSVDREFEREMELRLGNGESIRLIEKATAGVSSNQTLAYIESRKALIVGDLVHNGVHAWLEGGIVNGAPQPTVSSWISLLKEVRAEFDSDLEVFGGRGKSGPLAQSLDDQVNYLIQADKIVGDYVKSLGLRSQELKGDEAGVHHTVLSQLFEKAFPTYQHTYMIQYGVYGLTNSKL